MRLYIVIALLACVPSLYGSEYPAVMAEPNLEKRSALALKQADEMIEAAGKAYDQNNLAEFRTALKATTELVDLSYKSLVDTGKRARKDPKHWKRAELSIRTMMRKLDSLAVAVSVDERDIVTSARNHLSDVHDQVLHDVMTKK